MEPSDLPSRSFLEPQEDMSSRIIKALVGVAVAFARCMFFELDLWAIISEPARASLTALGVNPPELVAITPTEQFSVIYVEVPLTAAFFVSAPWVLYQLWAFIAPRLSKRERRWAVPFVLITAGLFIGCG